MRELAIVNSVSNKTIIAYTQNKYTALEQIQIILMNKLVSQNYNMHFIDLQGRGASLGVFNNKLDENAKYGFHTYISQKDLSIFFTSIEEQINNISTKIGPLNDIHEYNRRNAEKIREAIIVFYDFPYGIASEYIKKLALINNQAQRCGLSIYILSDYDFSQLADDYDEDVSFFNEGWDLIQISDFETAFYEKNVSFNFSVKDKAKLTPGMVVWGKLIQAQAFSSICAALSRMVLTFKISNTIEGTCFIDYTTSQDLLDLVSSLQQGDIVQIEIVSVSSDCVKVIPLQAANLVGCEKESYRLNYYDREALLSSLIDYKSHFDASKIIDTNYSNYYSPDSAGLSDSTFGLYLPIMVEMDGEHQVRDLVLGVNLYRHALITGSTSAGKSTFLHTIINYIITSYSPNDVELWLVDYAKVEFNRYYSNTPPHITFLGLENNRSFTYSFVAYIKKVFDERQELFAKANVKNIEEYKKKFGKDSITRIVLIVDEFHRMTQALRESRDYAQFLENALTEYRKYGLTCIFSNQTICGLIGLTETAEKQISVRIAMANTEDEMLTTLKAKSSDINSDLLMRMKNSAIGNLWIADIGDEIHHQIKGYHAIWMNNEQIECCIQKAKSNTPNWNYGKTIKISKIERTIFPTEDELQVLHYDKDDYNVPICLGNSFTVEGSLSITVKKNYDENVLICGKNTDMVFDIFRIFCENFSVFGNIKIYVFSDCYSKILNKFKQSQYRYNAGIEVVDDLSKMCAIINDIEEHVQKRQPFKENIAIFWLGFSSLINEFEHSPDKSSIKNLNIEQENAKERYTLGQIIKLAQDEEIIDAAQKYGMSVQDYLSMFLTETSDDVESTLVQSGIYNATKDIMTIVLNGSRLGCFNLIHFDSPYEMERVRDIKSSNFSHKILLQMSQPEMREFGITAIDYDDYKINSSTALYVGETKIKFCPYLFD